jgi:DNA-directed RNA polymerase subunit RPC12/RpoP
VEADYAVPDRCPGCGVRLSTGMDGMVEAEEGDIVIYPLSPQSEVESSDVMYLGFHCLQDWQRPVRCPRCGSDVRTRTAPVRRSPVLGDDRDFMETPVVDLELSVRARNAIHKAGVQVARDLLSLSAADIQRQVAAESSTVVDEVRRFLAARSLALRGES